MKAVKLKILMVDDNLKFIERMTGMLEHLNTVESIRVAHDYDEGYHSLLTEIPDIVLLDISLPGKNGIELLRRIKEAQWNCEVIMLTNNTNDYYRQLCQQLGAAYFFDKTIEFSKVPRIVEKLSLDYRPLNG